jgi:SAM-dependent MidA family methyltransferase
MQHGAADSLPMPDPASAAHSERMADHVRAAIAAADGDIGFAEYMHHVLYAPGLGYYSAGAVKFGAGGDFVTAPEVSPVFGAVLARELAAVLAGIGVPAILEFGAGSGRLAIDVLRTLDEIDALPAGGYRILEVSPELQERQADALHAELPGIESCVGWLDRPPDAFEGVVIANEVLDALPVERFVRRRDGVRQLRVAADGPRFVFRERAAPPALTAAVERIETALGARLPDGYVSEICLAAPSWIRELAGMLQAGAVFLFDYGVSRREYYAADRAGGWLRCHFRHRVHDDPLLLPGIQDLTAWVDFTAVAEAAADAGLDIAGYATQAQFLIGAGLERHLGQFTDLPMAAQMELSAGVKRLTLPGEMGENFKCMCLGRGLTARPRAFATADRTATL